MGEGVSESSGNHHGDRERLGKYYEERIER